MSDQQLPRDQQEQAFQNSPFETGQDYQGLASLNGFSTGVGIGVESGQEGAMRDAMSGVYPNPIAPFPNIAPTEPDITGFDAMSGITYPAIPVSMSGENMHYDGMRGQAVSFHEANAQPNNTVE